MLLLLIQALLIGTTVGSVLITAPKNILKDSDYTITVDILQSNGSVNVEASLLNNAYNYVSRSYELTPVLNISGNFNQGETGVLSMKIGSELECSNCRLNVRGRGGLQFEHVLYPWLSSSTLTFFIQTDKGVYKSGQTVRFRVLAIYSSLRIYLGKYNIEIRDASRNIIQVWNYVSNSSGLFEGSMTLGNTPVDGQWSITATTTTNSESYTQSFEVMNYDLPRFEVNVDSSAYALSNENGLTGKVKVTYTFGEPVKGTVELRVGPNRGPDYCGRPPQTTQQTFKIDGEAEFYFSKADVERTVNIYDGVQAKITAIVTESGTGITLNGSAVVTFYTYPYSISFTDDSPNYYKPGVPLQITLQVATPDAKPPTPQLTVTVHTYASYSYTLPNQSDYGIYAFSGTYPLTAETYVLPAIGLLPVQLEIPENVTSVFVTAYYDKKQGKATKSINKISSPSNSYLQVTLLDNNVESDTDVPIKIEGSKPLWNVSYTIVSRNLVVDTGILDGQGQKSFIFSLRVTPAMGPVAYIVVYYVSDENDVVADGLSFYVSGIFANKVSIDFSKNESQPHENLNLILTAEESSLISYAVVDQKVKLLKDGNDITIDRVQDSVGQLNSGQKPRSPDFALSFSSSYLQSVFSNVGLIVVYDLPSTEPSTTQFPNTYNDFVTTPEYEQTPGAPMLPVASNQLQDSVQGVPEFSQSKGQVEVERIRFDFTETWLWGSFQLAKNENSVEVEAVTPDSITLWVASAYALHPDKGLGVSHTQPKLTVFQQFFIDLILPTDAIRSEEVVVQAVVYNYLQQDVTVTVTLKGSQSFYSVATFNGASNEKSEKYIDGDQSETVTVKSQQQRTVYFPILLTAFGPVSVEVSARSSLAADAVRKSINVAPEGTLVTLNYPFIITRQTNSSEEYNNTIALTLPQNAVPGSVKITVQVTGDLIGPSLYNINNLISLPTGCGEPSLVKTAAYVYIAGYLDSIGQLSEDLKEHFQYVLTDGYQSALFYKNYNGSFSMYGSWEESGSTWFTAYVIRLLILVKQSVYVELELLLRGLDSLVDRQNQDGSFSEFGIILDKDIQGTSSSRKLTAFVLLTLLTSKSIISKENCTESNCNRAYAYGNATQKAVRNLEKYLLTRNIKPNFELAIVTWALSLAGSPKAEDALRQLQAQATQLDEFVFWRDETSETESSKYTIWKPNHGRATSLTVLATAYATLAYSLNGLFEDSLKIVNWLVNERGTTGGFSSTQATVVGIQALTAVATVIYKPDTNINISVSSNVETIHFNLNTDNALSLQQEDLDNTSSLVYITASGIGVAQFEVQQSYYSISELQSPYFDVAAIIMDDGIDSFRLMICSRWLLASDTGLVVQETSIPSGFQADLSTLNSVAGLRKSEIQGNKVVVYFDQLSQSTICYALWFSRQAMVARSQKGYISTFVFYEPSNQAITSYSSKSLETSTFCDVCHVCCVPVTTQGPFTSSITTPPTQTNTSEELETPVPATEFIDTAAGDIYITVIPSTPEISSTPEIPSKFKTPFITLEPKSLSTSYQPKAPSTSESRPNTFESKPVTLKEEPVTFVAQPVTPEGEPATFEEEPVTLKEEPVTFVAQPVTPETQPDTFEEEPVTFVAQPVTPETQPDTPETQPDTFEEEPVTFVAQPVTLVAEPDTPETQPDTFEEEPVTFVAQPVTLVAEPDTPETQPDTFEEEPVTFVAQPVTLVAEPDTPETQPDTPEEKSDFLTLKSQLSQSRRRRHEPLKRLKRSIRASKRSRPTK